MNAGLSAEVLKCSSAEVAVLQHSRLPRWHRRAGGVLLEVLLALALFVGAGLYTLSATRSVFDRLDHAQRQQQAADIAASKLAELEAGLINTADLRERMRSIGSIDVDEAWADRWLIELRTQRSEHHGLTLVELIVREARHDDGVNYTLRRLMRLRDEEAEEYELDDLLQGLEDVR